MSKYVCMGAQLQCSFGMSPGQLMVVDASRPMIENKLQATIMDYAPMVNILTFGMCQSMSNPTVASATAAAMGVLTPMPCVPAVVVPWSPAGKVIVGIFPALLDNAKCNCMWGGQISITNPGQNFLEGD
ncbi:MAG: DUF4280 domain-containing protein [Bacteroidales bacterium]|nr:DUF4280 domain-containing protein [Bacteroidales bacterium]